MSVLAFDDRMTCLPVAHGSGDFAWEVRRRILSGQWDRLAVPLPASFQPLVEAAVDRLPLPGVVIQRETAEFRPLENFDPAAESPGDDAPDGRASYVPIDPCQPVIAAIRIARQERIPISFIDLETNRFEPYGQAFPDPYALKKVPLERFASALLPAIGPLAPGQPQARARAMAERLRRLAERNRSILFVCSALDWPWIRHQYLFPNDDLAADSSNDQAPEDEWVEDPQGYDVAPESLLFLFGELPYIAGLYERANVELEDDANLAIDGVKELLLHSRDAYRAEFGKRARKITPHLLRSALRYARNLSLIERRFTPDLFTLATAAKQTVGDPYALHVVETARTYPYGQIERGHAGAFETQGTVKFGIEQVRLPDGDTLRAVSRLPGPPMVWRSLELRRKPKTDERLDWTMKWNPYSQCSWPPEDAAIERFRAHCFQKAQAAMGQDLARTEKFTTSVQDGIDIRDTLRHWHEGDIYVKVMPPARGRLDTCVMLFDSPCDPRDYPHRTTWYAEFEWESTLAFFATNFAKEIVGPGVAQSTYGGCLMIYPPNFNVPDIWRDERFDFCETLEERILAAACFHGRSKQVALLAPGPPGAGWRKLAKRYGKQLVHLPMSSFSEQTIQQLRTFHVLNGKHVRSYAMDFIRKA